MTCKPYIFVHDDEYYAYAAALVAMREEKSK